MKAVKKRPYSGRMAPLLQPMTPSEVEPLTVEVKVPMKQNSGLAQPRNAMSEFVTPLVRIP